MADFLRSDAPQILRKWQIACLAICWSCGLILGLFLYADVGFLYGGDFSAAMQRPLKLAGLLVCVYGPLLLSLYCVFTSRCILLYAICFVKACVSCLFLCCALGSFGSGGWIVWVLTLLPDGIGNAMLLVFCFRHIHNPGLFRWTELFWYGLCGIVAVALQMFLLEPIFRGVI